MAATISKVERPATYEDANLLLRLYELRREERLRKAREWFIKNFHASTMEEFQKLCPLGSKENAFYRMVVSYWEMAASFVTGGILHQSLFAQNSRELLFVWEDSRRRTAVAGNLQELKHCQKHGNRCERDDRG